MSNALKTVRAVHEQLDGEPWQVSRTQWLVPVLFTLEDGRTVQSNHGCRRAEVAGYVAALPRDVDVPLCDADVIDVMADMPLDHHHGAA